MRGRRALVAAAFLVTGTVAHADGPGDPVPQPFIVVLGIAQDGGAPHAGCRRDCCAARWLDPNLRQRVACLGIVDPQTSQRWLIDATPDLPQQLHALDRVAPPAEGGIVSGILLTHAHIGHYTGLMHLGREVMGAQEVPVHAMPRMGEFLSTNGPWDQLVTLGNIEIRPMTAGTPIELNGRITVTPLAVPHRQEYSEAVGFRIDGPSASVLYVPDIDKWRLWDLRVEDLIADVDAAYLDGTFYSADELPNRDMSKIPHPLITDSMQRFAALEPLDRGKVRFIHLNHTNPALRPDSAASAEIERAGFGVAEQGERVGL